MNFQDRGRWGRALVGGLVALSAGVVLPESAVSATSESISLLPVKFEISPDQRLGRKTSGLVCAPAGSWHWRDIAVDPQALETAIRDSLSRVGLQISEEGSEFGEPTLLSNLRLRGRVTEYILNSCAPWKHAQKLMGTRKIRGTGAVTVVWQLYSLSERKVIREEVTRSEFHSVEARDQTTLLVKVLAKNAEIFGSGLRRSSS